MDNINFFKETCQKAQKELSLVRAEDLFIGKDGSFQIVLKLFIRAQKNIPIT